LPAVSASACAVGSLALLIAAGVRESLVTTVVAGSLLTTILLVFLALARVLPGWSGPSNFPVWWWRVLYSGIMVGLMLFAVLLAALPAPAAIGPVSDRIDPVVAASAGLISVLPQIACGRARLASVWGAAGALAALAVAGTLMTQLGMSIDLIAAAGWIAGLSALNIARPCGEPTEVNSPPGMDATSSLQVLAISTVVAVGTVVAVVVDWALRRFM
jgi:hypothetical protein